MTSYTDHSTLWCTACGKRIGTRSAHVRVKARVGLSSVADGPYHARCIDKHDAEKRYDEVVDVQLVEKG